MTLPAVFVGDMPAQHRQMLRVMLRQQGINLQGVFSIDQRRHTVVMPSAESRAGKPDRDQRAAPEIFQDIHAGRALLGVARKT